MRISDWSSDVCSSDLRKPGERPDDDRLLHLRQLGDAREPVLAVDVHRIGPANALATRAAKCEGVVVFLDAHERRSEERRVGKECVSRVDLGGRLILKKKKNNNEDTIYGTRQSC